MASMWRRAMVYLGLQDDDELEYGGEYESYGEYGEPADAPQNARANRGGREDALGADAGSRDTGTVRTARDAPPDYGAPEPVAPRPMVREDPSGVSAPRPSCMARSAMTSRRVRVSELSSRGVLQFAQDTALGWVGRMLGGNATIAPPARPFTPIESAILERLIGYLLEDLAFSFGPLLDGPVALDNVQFGSQTAQAAEEVRLIHRRSMHGQGCRVASSRSTYRLRSCEVMTALSALNPSSGMLKGFAMNSLPPRNDDCTRFSSDVFPVMKKTGVSSCKAIERMREQSSKPSRSGRCTSSTIRS